MLRLYSILGQTALVWAFVGAPRWGKVLAAAVWLLWLASEASADVIRKSLKDAQREIGYLRFPATEEWRDDKVLADIALADGEVLGRYSLRKHPVIGEIIYLDAGHNRFAVRRVDGPRTENAKGMGRLFRSLDRPVLSLTVTNENVE